ncbi:hypothetical protein Ddc_15127 [Ditylenchus destructor]|nr:hypothetical protein Ddc_15127 [Ditylenchus destructor]
MLECSRVLVVRFCTCREYANSVTATCMCSTAITVQECALHAIKIELRCGKDREESVRRSEVCEAGVRKGSLGLCDETPTTTLGLEGWVRRRPNSSEIGGRPHQLFPSRRRPTDSGLVLCKSEERTPQRWPAEK